MFAEVALVVAGALAAAVFVAVVAAHLPASQTRFEAGLRAPVQTDPWPAQLVRLQRVVEWSQSSGVDAHTRLRPVLVEIAELRLARRGLRLDRDPVEARRLLGPAAWELVRPDRPPPLGRDAPGVEAHGLDEVLEALEAL